MSFHETVETIRRLLLEERQSHEILAPHERAPLASCEQRRRRINDLLAQLPQRAKQDIAALYQAMASLPHIPSSQEIEWARGVLALPNLAILELDMTNLSTSAFILRVTLLNGVGQLVDDLLVHPPHVPSQVALDLAGITKAQLATASALETVWSHIQTTLTGRYVISFLLEPYRDRFMDEARRRQLVPLTMLGASLRPHCGAYFGEIGYGLETLCSHIGVPLPQPPARTSHHRAYRQLQILHTMAQGKLLWHEGSAQASQQPVQGGAYEQ
ncbi:hypothetical protein [Ktedonospora formicarum]|uniref:Uncharacterized protein n=1 Tax=Ktedonospora formicarum TaxID=2778364 RepID=A0A8J3I4D4_9CHLR|nr:hypothetical protein [Ktedonospora formicarum]GHO48486.1 hypothetical protein KSX_66490 [Ktedonospora formicarum]